MLHRMWKYRFHYVIVIPALIWIFVYKVIPFIEAFMMTFKAYDPALGLSGSPWVGWSNFAMLFDSPFIWRVLSNTLVLNFGYIIVSSIVALIIVLALCQIKSSRLRNAFTTWFLVPYFIPSVVLVYIVALLLSPATSPIFQIEGFPLGNPETFRPLLIALEVLKFGGIPIILGLAAVTSTYAAHAIDR